MLTRDDLQRFAPRPGAGERAANWDAYVEALVEHGGALCAEFGIDTALELQHFMAQIAHESGGFTVLWEDMKNYRPERIMEIFGVGRHSAKVTLAEARNLSGKPKELAERVYGLGNTRKAIELGNIEPGDGYKYRGYGPMQVTGRKDHERLMMGDHSVRGALRAAFAEWDEKHCNELAARDDIKSITKRINGGHNGLEDRKRYLAKAKRIWPLFPGADAPEMTTQEAVQVSTKAKAADALVKVSATTAAVGTLVEAADPLAQATAQITSVNMLTSALATFAGFVKGHATLGLIVMALVGCYFGRHMIAKIRQDFKEGRYFPKEAK